MEIIIAFIIGFILGMWLKGTSIICAGGRFLDELKRKK
jgi:hypothetical protein